MQIELTIKKYLDSSHEVLIADLPDTGAIVKVADGIHARLLLKHIECPTNPNSYHCTCWYDAEKPCCNCDEPKLAIAKPHPVFG